MSADLWSIHRIRWRYEHQDAIDGDVFRNGPAHVGSEGGILDHIQFQDGQPDVANTQMIANDWHYLAQDVLLIGIDATELARSMPSQPGKIRSFQNPNFA